MRFFIIYSFDIRKDASVIPHKPPLIKRWTMTENDDNYEFDYLADECGDEVYRNGKHRKYMAELNKEQFKQFIEDQELWLEDIETMGSLTEHGILPALYFRNDDDDPYIISKIAFVTPLPEHAIKGKELIKTQNERNWNRIKQALLNLHGFNYKWANRTYKNYFFRIQN